MATALSRALSDTYRCMISGIRHPRCGSHALHSRRTSRGCDRPDCYLGRIGTMPLLRRGTPKRLACLLGLSLTDWTSDPDGCIWLIFCALGWGTQTVAGARRPLLFWNVVLPGTARTVWALVSERHQSRNEPGARRTTQRSLSRRRDTYIRIGGDTICPAMQGLSKTVTCGHEFGCAKGSGHAFTG